MLSVDEIIKIAGANLINGNGDFQITKFNVSKSNHNENDLYIPIVWRQDRHEYILDAVKKGASGYLVSSSY